MINVHHLELFYYVAKYEGIGPACRHMPYGIQQPAMSTQMQALEESLRVPLFERRPFKLTSAGRALYDFVAPFFSRLGELEDVVSGRGGRIIRLAGLTEVMREHVPEILAKMTKRFADLKFTLQEIDQRGAEKLIAEGGADLAITVLHSKLPVGFRSVTLVKLPLCLIVSKDETLGVPAIIKAGAEGDIPLVSLPADERLPKMFQEELRQRKISWRTSIETSSQDLVSIYVRNGLGVGLGVMTPDLEKKSGVKVLPLKGFPVLPIGAFWRGKPGEVTQAFIEELLLRSAAFA